MVTPCSWKATCCDLSLYTVFRPPPLVLVLLDVEANIMFIANCPKALQSIGILQVLHVLNIARLAFAASCKTQYFIGLWQARQHAGCAQHSSSLSAPSSAAAKTVHAACHKLHSGTWQQLWHPHETATRLTIFDLWRWQVRWQGRDAEGRPILVVRVAQACKECSSSRAEALGHAVLSHVRPERNRQHHVFHALSWQLHPRQTELCTQ